MVLRQAQLTKLPMAELSHSLLWFSNTGRTNWLNKCFAFNNTIKSIKVPRKCKTYPSHLAKLWLVVVSEDGDFEHVCAVLEAVDKNSKVRRLGSNLMDII